MTTILPATFPATTTDPAITPVERSYLEVIYYLADRGEPVIAAQIGRWLHVSAPTVSNVLQRIEAKGLIVRTGAGMIALSPSGHAIAEQIVRRHRLIERFLYDTLAIPWHEIHREASRLEAALSPLLEARIAATVGRARTCPHGNPIPGQAEGYPADLPLTKAPVGARMTITRIDEEAGEDSCTLQLLWVRRLIPGAQAVRLLDSRQGIALRVAERQMILPLRVAALVRAAWEEPIA